MKNKLIFGIAFSVNLLFLVSLILCFIYGFEAAYLAIFISFLLAAYHTNLRLIIGFLGLLFIKDKIKISRKIYRVKKEEYNFLTKFNMKKWKEKYFAMDKSQFILKKLSKNAVEQVIRNNINAELTHWLCIIAGEFSILIGCLISLQEWWIYVITAFIATVVVDALPIMIQRYNRYRLQGIYEMLCKKEGNEL